MLRPGVEAADEASGDDGGLTNIDFVSSTRRPPRGGPSMSGGAKDGCEGAGDDEGPAPGDCGGRGGRTGDGMPADGRAFCGGALKEVEALRGGALAGAVRGAFDGGPDAGRGIGGFDEKSSNGGMYDGRGALTGF